MTVCSRRPELQVSEELLPSRPLALRVTTRVGRESGGIVVQQGFLEITQAWLFLSESSLYPWASPFIFLRLLCTVPSSINNENHYSTSFKEWLCRNICCCHHTMSTGIVTIRSRKAKEKSSNATLKGEQKVGFPPEASLLIQ